MILSLDEAREIQPDITQERLDGFETLVREYTRNHFLVREARLYDLTFDGSGVTDFAKSEPHLKVAGSRRDTSLWDEAKSAPIDWFTVNSTVEIGGAEINDGVYTITAAEGKILNLDGVNTLASGYFKQSYLTLIRYPSDIKTGIIKLIQYDMAMSGKVGIKEERYSRMQIQYYDISTQMKGEGYPQVMISFLDKYVQARY